MKTIYSDGKSLEIERILNITITMPQICYFCGEEITEKFGQKSKSLCFHSLDGDHGNWDPSNKVPTHRGCHQSFHMEGHWTGDKNPMKNPETAAKQGMTMRGDKNPSCRPEVVAKISKALTGRTFSEEHKRNLSDAMKKSWIERKSRMKQQKENP